MLPKGSSGKDYIKEIIRIHQWVVDRKSNHGMCNVRLTCDADVAATESIKIFKK